MKHLNFLININKKGSLLLESLFAMFVLCLLLNVSSIMFRQLNQIKLDSNIDIAYCIYSMTHDINTSNKIEVFDHSIFLYQEQDIYEFTMHNQYLVKKPGFNIYLHQLDSVYFYHDETYVYMNISRGDLNETFIIGIYKRPQQRFCEPNDVGDIPITNQHDCISDNINK